MVDVVLEGEAPNGFAQLLAGLVEANAAHDPAVARLLERTRGAAQLEVSDVGTVVGLKLVPGAVTVTSAPVAGAEVRLQAEAEVLLGLSSVPLRGGLPDPFTRAGRDVVVALVARRLRVRLRPGGLRMLRTLNRVLTTAAVAPAFVAPAERP